MAKKLEVFRKAIVLWEAYLERQGGPDWVLDYLCFLEQLAGKSEQGRTRLTDEDKSRLREICPGGLGPLGGFAVREVADVEVGNILAAAQEAADGLKRRLLWQRSVAVFIVIGAVVALLAWLLWP